MAVKYTQTFKTYEDAAAEARRAQAMAEALQQQAYQPIQMDTAGPISYTQGLAKILQSYLAGKEGRKAREAEAESKRLGREEFKDYISAFEPETPTTPVEMATATPSLQKRMELKPQNLDLGQIAQGMGTPTISEQGTMGYTPPTAPMPSAGPMQFTTGSLTPAQRRAKILEGMGSGNPMVQAVAQAEYTKPSMAGKLGDVAPDKFTPASLAQYQATGNAAVLVPVERESKAPSAVQEYEYAKLHDGYKGSFTDWTKEQKQAGATRLNVDTKGTQLGQEYFLKELSDQHKIAKGAQGILNRLDTMADATKKGTFTGGTAPGAMAATQWLAGLGINVAPATLANSRTFEAAKSQLFLDFMAANGGARGFTQDESAILNQSFPQIVDNPAAREAISNVIRAKAKRDVDLYNSNLSDFTSTFPGSRIPYKPMSVETKEDRYQRWLRSQGGAR